MGAPKLIIFSSRYSFNERKGFKIAAIVLLYTSPKIKALGDTTGCQAELGISSET